MSKNIKQILIIKDVIKPNLPLIFLISPYAHLMGQPTNSRRYSPRTAANTSGQKVCSQSHTIEQIYSVYNMKPSCSNLPALPLTLALNNELIRLPFRNLSSSVSLSTETKIFELD